MAAKTHRVFLIPGMFGFSRLAGVEYFVHLKKAIEERFHQAGLPVEVSAISSLPTASLRRRAGMLALAVSGQAGTDDGPIHLVGHSTGGLDARLVVTPNVRLKVPDSALSWIRRVRTIVSMNTPHYGTPLAAFFATVSGTRLLYALSLLTVTTLTVGSGGFGALSRLVAVIGSLDEVLGTDSKFLDRTTGAILRYLEPEAREETQKFLSGIRLDQGGILQITPEGMDLFNAATPDSPNIRYGCVATVAPPPGPRSLIRAIRSPYAAASHGIYATLSRVSCRPSQVYPYARPDDSVRLQVERGLGHPLRTELSDGVVPTQSMIWGQPLWCGHGDHLDVVGHFNAPPVHVDWLNSGARYDRVRFSHMMDQVVGFLLEA